MFADRNIFYRERARRYVEFVFCSVDGKNVFFRARNGIPFNRIYGNGQYGRFEFRTFFIRKVSIIRSVILGYSADGYRKSSFTYVSGTQFGIFAEEFGVETIVPSVKAYVPDAPSSSLHTPSDKSKYSDLFSAPSS